MASTEDLIVLRRLRGAQRQGIPASLAFDLATIDDDEIIDTLGSSGVPTLMRPNGLGEFMHRALFESAAQVPVPELRLYQQRLKDLGYLPSDFVPDGVWEPGSRFSQAHYRFGNDQGEKIYQGHGPGSLATEKALGLLVATLPSQVWKGTQGLARGFLGFLKSLGGTVLDIADPFTELFESVIPGRQDIIHRDHSIESIGTDILNVLTVASAFAGVSQLALAGRAALGMTGAEFGAQAAARFGFVEGLSPLARAASVQPSITTRIGAGLVRKASLGRANGFADWMLEHASIFKAQQSRPILRAAGQAYSGASKLAFGPNVAAILDPHSELGLKVNEQEALPWWTDLSTLVVAPQSGLIPKGRDLAGAGRAIRRRGEFMGMFAPRAHGPIDPWDIVADIPKPVTPVERAGAVLDAYIQSRAVKTMTSKAQDAVRAGGGLRREAFVRAYAAERKRALVGAGTAERKVSAEYFEQAMRWGDENPEAVAAYLRDLHNSALERTERGLIGFNPDEAYQAAEAVAVDYTNTFLRESIAAERLSQEVSGLRLQLKSLLERRDPRAIEVANKMTQREEALAALADQLPRAARSGFEATPTPIRPGSRVVPMRADNPLTQQNVRRVRRAVNSDPHVRDPQLRADLDALGLETVPSAELVRHLDALERVVAVEVEVPARWGQAFAEHGYRPVAVGQNVVLRSDFSPLVRSAQEYSSARYAWASLGVSSRRIDQRALSRLSYSTARDAVDDVLGAGEGDGFLRRLRADMDEVRRTLGAEAAKGGLGARAMNRYQAGLLNIRDASVPRIRELLERDYGMAGREAAEKARSVKRAISRSFAHPGFIASPAQSFRVLHEIAAAVRAQGLPGLSEFLRGVAIGGPESKIWGRWAGYGFLPERLMRGALALRFQLNPLFEAQNFTESQMVRAAAEELSPVARPLHRMRQLGVEDQAREIYARSSGINPNFLDDAEQVILRQGLFGYSLQDHAIYDHWRVYQREVKAAVRKGVSETEADERAIEYLAQNGWKFLSYGPRTQLERSVNFVFFPFSFQKKVATLTADFLTAQPVRTLLVHETMRRVELAERLDEFGRSNLATWLKRYAPAYKELSRFNAFSYGVNLGQFGGPFKNLAAALAVPVEVVAGAFLPFAGRAEDTRDYTRTLKRLVPAISAISGIIESAAEQAQVTFGQKTESTDAQIDDYRTLKGALEEEYDRIAAIWGVSGVQGLLLSARVPQFVKAQYIAARDELVERFPDGARHLAMSGSRGQLQQQALDELLRKTNKTRAEKAIVALEVKRLSVESLFTGGVPTPEGRLIHRTFVQRAMREEALRLYDLLGKPFEALWAQLGYEYQFGPIAIEEAA